MEACFGSRGQSFDSLGENCSGANHLTHGYSWLGSAWAYQNKLGKVLSLKVLAL